MDPFIATSYFVRPLLAVGYKMRSIKRLVRDEEEKVLLMSPCTPLKKQNMSVSLRKTPRVCASVAKGPHEVPIGSKTGGGFPSGISNQNEIGGT